MTRKTVALASCFLLAFGGSAEGAGVPFGQFGLHLAIGFPQADFRQNVQNPGVGLNLNLEGGPARRPISIGVGGGFIVYGRESRREPFSTTIPDVTVEVVTSNNLAFGNLYVRVAPRSLAIRPYAIFMGGLHYLYTRTEIKNVSVPEEEVASSTNFSDTAWSYAVGMGIQFLLREAETKDSNTRKVHRVRLFADVQVRYQRGGLARYLKRGPSAARAAGSSTT